MNPYYEDENCTIFNADCRELIFCEMKGDAIITDPPYGETSLAWDVWPEGWPSLFPQVAPQLWCFGSMRMFLEQAGEFKDWKFAQDIVWEKQNGSGFASDRFKRVHEMATHWYSGTWGDLYLNPPMEQRESKLYSRKKAPTHTGAIGVQAPEMRESRIMRSVVAVRNCHGYAEHPTQKPEGIIRPLIEYSVPSGGTVIDLFMGSGTTLRVAKDMGRKAIGIDKGEKWCEIAARRLQQEVLAL